MISHKHKCIFIHIARTGGSSVEEAIMGKDWCHIDRDTKHISAIQAQKLYTEETWEEYFTFSFVRNPWDRVISMWKRKAWLNNEAEEHDLKSFILNLGIHEREKYNSQLFSEILYPGVDFIGRFETLKKDFKYICRQIGLERTQLPHIQKTEHKHYSTYYTDKTKELVGEKFKKDIELFEYSFEKP